MGAGVTVGVLMHRFGAGVGQDAVPYGAGVGHPAGQQVGVGRGVQVGSADALTCTEYPIQDAITTSISTTAIFFMPISF